MDTEHCVSEVVMSLLGSVGGSEHSGNDSPISNPAFFLMYFLGASCSFPTSSAIYLSASISDYSLHCVGRRNMKTEDKTAVVTS